VTLTPKGRREVAELDRRSDAFATSVLAPLSATQRQSLTAAMAEVERLMRPSAIRIEIEAAGSADARWCLVHYFSELAARFEAGFDPARSISASAEELTPPAGVFVVARLGGRPVGCGALKRKDRRIGEIKRMWVSSDTRGLGIGRRILEALEARARTFGLRTLRLETNHTLEEAQALYRGCGYVEVAPFNDEPYAHHWFEKQLKRVGWVERLRRASPSFSGVDCPQQFVVFVHLGFNRLYKILSFRSPPATSPPDARQAWSSPAPRRRACCAARCISGPSRA
jgi:GNAT superfamily N-acetyltransferase